MDSIVTVERIGKRCTGCAACVSACPESCISFVRDEEGFPYPVIDRTSCVECGVCLGHCHLCSTPDMIEMDEVYAGFFKDKRARRSSSSGGAFFAFSRFVISEQGVVFGAALDSRSRVSHRSVESLDVLQLLQKSKYVQSDTEGVYQEVKRLLADGRNVLFSGCPCQVAGLKSYLGRDYEGLITVDLICHGVPSPGAWEDHIDGLLGSSSADSITFRRKDYTARTTFSLDIEGDGFKVRGRDAYDDAFLALFVMGATLRESCYECPYASCRRVGDITLGDCASSDCYRGFYPWEQLSTIAINTPKGRELWGQVKKDFCFRSIDAEKEIALNAQLTSPSKRPACRDGIFKDIEKEGESVVANRLSPARTFGMRAKRVIKHCVPNLVRGRLIWLRAMVLGE